MATFEECAAATDAVGWDVTYAEVDVAVETHEGVSLEDLRDDLEGCVTAFEARGGRGVSLANRIDSLRIAIAVREFHEANG